MGADGAHLGQRQFQLEGSKATAITQPQPEKRGSGAKSLSTHAGQQHEHGEAP